MQAQHGTRASALLDLARSMAAVAVFAGHARNIFFVDHRELGATVGPVTQGFYFATGLGHEAVMVFFVLSGFFIGQAIMGRHAPGSQWSWGGYLVNRFSRLHVVLLPALLLTLLCDVGGAALMPSLYDGSHPGGLMPPDIGARHGVDVFLSNNLYLQTIAGPTFGSNGPLWSVAYELWFYLLFPLALRALLSRNLVERAVCAILAVGATLLVGQEVLLYFPIWLLGVALTRLKAPRMPARWLVLMPWLSGVLLACALTLSRARPGLASDYLLGLAVAVWIYAVTSAPRAEETTLARWARAAVWLAAFSYTLYAVHLPFVFLVRAVLGEGPRYEPSTAMLAALFGILVLAVIYAWAVSRLTEARTPALRRALKRLLRLEPARTRTHP